MKLACAGCPPDPPKPENMNWKNNAEWHGLLPLATGWATLPLPGRVVQGAEWKSSPSFALGFPALIGRNEGFAGPAEDHPRTNDPVGRYRVGPQAMAALFRSYVVRDDNRVADASAATGLVPPGYMPGPSPIRGVLQ